MGMGDIVRIDGEWKTLVCGNDPRYSNSFCEEQPVEDTIKPISPNNKPYPYLTNQPESATNKQHTDNTDH